MRGAPEEMLLLYLQSHPHISVARRCADSGEVLAAALAGIGTAAVIDHALGVDRSLITRLRKTQVRVIVLAPAADHRTFEAMGAAVVDSDSPDLGPAVLAALGSEAPTAPVPAEEAHPLLPGRPDIFAVLSPWGAPGRTTVAVNVAAELAARGESPLLIDADVWGSSLRQFLGLDSDAPGLAAAIRAIERGSLDVAGLRRLIRDHPAGMSVLGGLAKAERWREAAGVVLEEFWQTVTEWPGPVVVDGPVRIPLGGEHAIDEYGPRPNDMWASILEAASAVCLVGAAETIGIHRFINFYLDISERSLPAAHVVINRVRESAAGPQPRASIHELLARFAGVVDPVLVTDDPVGMDRALLAAGALPQHAPRSPARQGIQELCARLHPAPAPGGRRRWRRRERTRSE